MQSVSALFAGSGLLVFFLVSVALAGAASFAAGRAAALAWKPLRACAVYGALIGMAAAFLHYALFQQPVIPLGALWENLAGMLQAPMREIGGLIANLAGFGLEFVVQTAFAAAGYMSTRRAQMARQYGFARRKSTA